MAHLALRDGTPVRTQPFHPWPIFDDREKQALMRTLESGVWGIGSQEIEKFEQEFAEFCRARFAVACANGTDAIYIALQAMNVGCGDEVIVPPYTFIATAIAVLMVNAVPVFADIDPNTCNLDPESVKEKITAKTKAIIPVHIAGNPADMDRLSRIAEERHLWVLEDCAQAHGAEWRGKRVGTLGHAGTFSFQSTKNLASGEGGAIVTDDEALADRLRSFTNCGRVRGGLWYDHHEMAGNHRLGAFQAALLRVGLERIDEQMRHRSESACALAGLLREIPGVSLYDAYPGTTRHAYHLCILRYRKSEFQDLPKSRFVEALQKEGIPCASGYLPLYRYHFFQHFPEKVNAYSELYAGKVNYNAVLCPVCERICEDEAVWLFQEMLLGSKKDMETIAEAIAKIQKYAEEIL